MSLWNIVLYCEIPWKIIKIFSENGNSIRKKKCFNYYVQENLFKYKKRIIIIN